MRDKPAKNAYAHVALKRFLLIILPLASLVTGTAAIHYITYMESEKISHELDEEYNVSVSQKLVTNELRTVISDLTFLSKLNELWAILDHPDNDEAKQMLAQEFLYFSEKKAIYDQIRLIDSTGIEVVRINYDQGSPTIVRAADLQNKSERYYFQEAMAQDLGGIYISPFDLNMEGNLIDRPFRPVLRFATPIYDSHGIKRGIIILNYMGEKLIERFRLVAAKTHEQVNLVNADGFWLSAPVKSDEWGFSLKHQRSFASSFPDAWKQILSRNSGRFYNKDGLFTFATVYPLEPVMALYARVESTKLPNSYKGPFAGRPGFWKIISQVPPPMLSKASYEFQNQFLLFYFAIFALSLVGAGFIAQTSAKNYLARTQNEYEQQFRRTLETIQLAAVTLNKNGKVTFCNDFFLTLTGRSHEEVIGKDWFDTFVHQKDQIQAREIFSKIFDGDPAPTLLETPIKTIGNESRLVSWNNTLTRDHAGTITALTCIGKDVTEQRKTEEQLKKLSLAVEQSPNPVIITNAQGIIEYVNPKFTQVTGYTSEEARGQNPRLLKSGETDAIAYKKLWETISSGKEWRGIFHNQKKNGELYWDYTAISSIRNSQNKITHFLAIKEDVTERRRLKEEVKERKKELSQAKTLAAMGRMASMIAHDLRNPLSSVKMTLQILGKRAIEKGDSEAEELQQISLDQVHYMEEILSDLLAFSRPDALNPEWLSINKLLDTAVSTTQKAIREYQANVTTEYQHQLPTVHGDPTKLRQVFSNLIMNAVESGENTGKALVVTIKAELELNKHAPKIRIEIRDNGIGFDNKLSDKLFEPFFTTRAKGTGLGLPIVKRIVNQHQGTVNLVHSDNGGTCAIVILPTGPVQL